LWDFSAAPEDAGNQGSMTSFAPDKARQPPAVTVEMAKGFTLYMLKALLSGRGDEIVVCARTCRARRAQVRVARPSRLSN
jgi:hypothetical protein